jgi:hypothetical protein
MEQTAVAVTATYRPFTHSLLNSEWTLDRI